MTQGRTHEDVSARKSDGLVVSPDDGTVDAVCELINVLRKDTWLKRWVSTDTTNVTASDENRAAHSCRYGVVGCFF